MFKKSKRNFRTKRSEVDSDEENESIQNESLDKPKVEQTLTIREDDAPFKQTQLKPESKTTKLSFEEEEETEEFKVKKSKESRRIAKELKKSKKEKQANPNENGQNKIEIKQETEIVFNEEIRIKPLKKVEKNYSKYITNKYRSDEIKSDDEFSSFKVESDDDKEEKLDDQDETDKLKRLREEFEILTGEDLDPVERETDEAKRSMKLMLKSGIIPDANLIHEARKKREMARQGDYIPIGRQTVPRGKSTLIREDDEDLSEDEHGTIQKESRVTMNYREASQKERQITRSNFLAFEQGSDDEKKSDLSEDELERWEKEQIKKGVQISQLSSNDFKDMKKAKFIEKLLGSNFEPEPMDIDQTYEKTLNLDKLNNLPQITFLSIKDSLKTNLSSLEETHRAHFNEFNMTSENLKASKLDLEKLNNSKPLLDKQYVYYQEMKGYLTDFIDCYNEKLPEIEKAEQKWLEMYKEKSSQVLKRRTENLRDQNTETTASMSTNKKAFEAEHLRRMAVRENRRKKRQVLKEETRKILKSNLDLIEFNDGFSTDDEENPTDEDIFKQKKNEILAELNTNIFTDVLEDFYNFETIKSRFEKWKILDEQNYKNAFISLSLPKIFSPLIRTQLIDWNPVDETDSNCLEKMKWFKDLLNFNKKDLTLDKNDDDFMLIPYIVEKIVLQKLINIVESVYDPFSKKQSQNFSGLFLNLVKTYPTINGQSLNAKKFIETLIARFKKTFEEEVFVPLYSKQLIQQRTSEASKFFYRQFYACVKIFSNVLEWKEILSESVLKELAIDCLLNRYMLIGLQNLNSDINTIYLIEYIVSKLPKKWLETNIESTSTMSLPQLASLIRLVRRITDNIHEKDFKTNRITPNEFKEQIQITRKLFIKMGAADQAALLTNAYE